MKKYMNNFVSCLIVSSVIFMMISLSCNGVQYSDVPTSYDGFYAVNYVSDNGLMGAIASDSFGTTTLITRGMLVNVLYRKEGEPSVTINNPFTDVSSSSSYYDAVRWAYSNGIVNGTSSTTFSPSNNVTRQDIATFLYRYAQNCGYNLADELVSTTQISDYDNISNYAREPVRWVLGNGIIPYNSATNYSPSVYMDRGHFAQTIVNFGLYAEGINIGKDTFSFVNDMSDFKPSNVEDYVYNYYMTRNHQNQLINTTEERHPDSNFSQFIANILYDEEKYESQENVWTGACFGMSAAVLLDKTGHIDFNGNFSTATNMYGVSKPANQQLIASVIHYYQLIQHIPEFKAISRTSPSLAKTQELIESVQRNGAVLFGYEYIKNSETKAHMVVVYDYIYSGGKHYFMVYDPNCYANEDVVLRISETGATAHFIRDDIVSEQVNKFRIIDDYTYFDIYDIDGTYNQFNHVSTSGISDESIASAESYLLTTASSTVELSFPVNTDCIITNSKGETLINNNGQLFGTMEIVNSNTSFASDPVWYIQVNADDSFIYSSEYDKYDFSLLSNDSFYRVVGTDIESINMSEDGFEITGDKGEFISYIYTGDSTAPTMKVAGDYSDAVSVDRSLSTITVTGNENDCQVTAYDGINDVYTKDNISTSKFTYDQNSSIIQEEIK